MVPRDYTGQLGKCSDLGIIGPVVGTIGNLQALLTIQYLAELPEFKSHQLMTFDAKRLDWQKWQLMADPDCEICAEKEVDTNHAEGMICPSL
jgi:sulfur carrier protein ThiS adenylyltransferase